MYIHFSINAIASNGTLHLYLGLLRMHSVAASIWAVIKVSCLSFGVCLSDISCRLLNLFLRVTIHRFLISQCVSEDLSYCEALIDCVISS